MEFRLDFWHQKTRVPGLSYVVVCMILYLAVLIQDRRVTDVRTDGYTMTRYTALCIASRGKNVWGMVEEVFTGRMPFLPLKYQCQSIKRTQITNPNSGLTSSFIQSHLDSSLQRMGAALLSMPAPRRQYILQDSPEMAVKWRRQWPF